MRKIVVAALSVVLVIASLTAQSQNAIYLRENVESWTEPSKSRALRLMSQCRAAADSFLPLWSGGTAAEIYATLGKEFRDRTPLAEFANMFNVMERAHGRVTATEYRNQAVLLELGDNPSLLRRPTIQVVYSVRTTTPGKSEVFLELYLASVAGPCQVVGMRYQQYFNAVPPWLRKQSDVKSSA